MSEFPGFKETLEGVTVKDFREEEEYSGEYPREEDAEAADAADAADAAETAEAEDEKAKIEQDAYKGRTYSKADKFNMIKKIDAYLSDPDLRKMVIDKIHLAPYIDLKSMKKRKDFNELDPATINWIYDELKNTSMQETISDFSMKGYVAINQLVEDIAVKSGYVPELEGYAQALDTRSNRILVKQITIDNLDYFSGKLSPQALLMIKTTACMMGTYSENKKNKILSSATQEKTTQEKTTPNAVTKFDAFMNSDPSFKAVAQ